jgi:hypothetical protein
MCCVTPFITLRSKFNVLCIYVSDFKEPYPARTAYQVAKLPLVRDVLSFGYGCQVWGLYSDDCEDCCLLWCIVFWCNCAKGQCSYVRLQNVTSQNTAALTVSNYSWSICCNVWKYASQHLHACMKTEPVCVLEQRVLVRIIWAMLSRQTIWETEMYVVWKHSNGSSWSWRWIGCMCFRIRPSGRLSWTQ